MEFVRSAVSFSLDLVSEKNNDIVVVAAQLSCDVKHEIIFEDIVQNVR